MLPLGQPYGMHILHHGQSGSLLLSYTQRNRRVCRIPIENSGPQCHITPVQNSIRIHYDIRIGLTCELIVSIIIFSINKYSLPHVVKPHPYDAHHKGFKNMHGGNQFIWFSDGRGNGPENHN